jgi:hypothetical protein
VIAHVLGLRKRVYPIFLFCKYDSVETIEKGMKECIALVAVDANWVCCCLGGSQANSHGVSPLLLLCVSHCITVVTSKERPVVTIPHLAPTHFSSGEFLLTCDWLRFACEPRQRPIRSMSHGFVPANYSPVQNAARARRLHQLLQLISSLCSENI